MSRAPPNILGILQPIGLKFGVSLPVPKPSSHTKFEPNWLGSFGEMDWKPIYVIKSINWSFLRNYPTDLAQILCASRVRIRASADKISAQSVEGHQCSLSTLFPRENICDKVTIIRPSFCCCFSHALVFSLRNLSFFPFFLLKHWKLVFLPRKAA